MYTPLQGFAHFTCKGGFLMCSNTFNVLDALVCVEERFEERYIFNE